MSTFGGQPQPIRQGASGALSDRAACPRSGSRRAQGTLERSGKVYGATPFVPEVVAEAPQMGAGSHVWRGDDLRNERPRGSAAGGTAERIVDRRCGLRFDHRRWSR